MFVELFHELRRAGVPVSLKEYLVLMEAMDARIANVSVEDFYHLSRATLVKDERNFDKFDVVFGHLFRGLESLDGDRTEEIPEEWLRKLAELALTEEEMAEVISAELASFLAGAPWNDAREQRRQSARGGQPPVRRRPPWNDA